MSTFAYKGLDPRGTQANGQIDSDSKAAAAAALRNRGLTVLDLNEVKKGLGQIQIGGSASRPRTSRSSRASSPPW